MFREMKFHVKAGLLIFSFSLLITLAFTAAMLWFGRAIYLPGTKQQGLYPLSALEYEEIIRNNGTLQINAEKVLGASHYHDSMADLMLKRLFPISAVFLLVLFLLSVCLWLFLKSLYEKRIIKIAEQMKDVETGFSSSDYPILNAAYEQISQKFDDSLSDYKRLNSYLSHEQKNAIAILRTNMELSDNRSYLKNLDDIADSIDDILTLSENADTSPLASVDVALVCAEVYDNYKKITDTISFDFDDEADTEILARSRWIYRAIANILDNALKYGEDKPIVLSVQTKKGSVIVQVRDHGIGISEEQQEAIFQNRYRINELKKDGYGIGLSLVSHVCDLCGGFVAVESQQGKGSVFYLSFPQKPF
ncbi:HAMP domain-containing sensor histidine kinase [Lachnospiraceae bacterium 48-33]